MYNIQIHQADTAKTFGFYWTKEGIWPNCTDFIHDYTQEFYQSYSFYICKYPRTDKFHGVWPGTSFSNMGYHKWGFQNNSTCCFLVITHPCPKFNDCLSKLITDQLTWHNHMALQHISYSTSLICQVSKNNNTRHMCDDHRLTGKALLYVQHACDAVICIDLTCVCTQYLSLALSAKMDHLTRSQMPPDILLYHTEFTWIPIIQSQI